MLGEERGEAGRADLLLALGEHLHVAGQRAGRVEPCPHDGEVRDHARLVVGGAATEQAAVDLAGLERVAAPTIDEAGRLDVVVRVQQHRGRAGRVRPLADHVRMPAVDDELPHGFEAGLLHERLDRIGAHPYVGGVRGIGADARDAHEVVELPARPFEVGG